MTRKYVHALATTRNYSQVLFVSHSQVARKSLASYSQVTRKSQLGANPRKSLASPWICEYTCTQVYRNCIASPSQISRKWDKRSQLVYFI